jgi:hypothetical protein
VGVVVLMGARGSVAAGVAVSVGIAVAELVRVIASVGVLGGGGSDKQEGTRAVPEIAARIFRNWRRVSIAERIVAQGE